MPETLVFYALSGLAIGASALVIGQRNPMYSVLLLIASFTVSYTKLTLPKKFPV